MAPKLSSYNWVCAETVVLHFSTTGSRLIHHPSWSESVVPHKNWASYLHLFILTWSLFLRFFRTVSLALLLFLISLHLDLQRGKPNQMSLYSTESSALTSDDKGKGNRGWTCSSLSLACSVSIGSSVSSDFCTSTREALDTLKIPWMFTRTLTLILELSPDACGTTFWMRNWPVRRKTKTVRTVRSQDADPKLLFLCLAQNGQRSLELLPHVIKKPLKCLLLLTNSGIGVW